MDKQKACEAIHNLGGCDATDEWSKGYDAGIAAALEAIEALPAADVQPVKHGRWGEDDEVLTWEGTFPFHSCSMCGFTLCDDIYHINGSEPIDISKRFRYCPECGARMDGGADNAR